MNLIKNTPNPNVTFSIEFKTDYDHFEKTVTVSSFFKQFHIRIFELKTKF